MKNYNRPAVVIHALILRLGVGVMMVRAGVGYVYTTAHFSSYEIDSAETTADIMTTTVSQCRVD